MTNIFFRYHFPALLWAVVVIVLTLLPAAALPEPPEWKFLSFNTFAHIGVFALLALLVFRSFYHRFGSKRYVFYAMAFTAALCLFLGIITELLQTVMKMGRQGDSGDVLADFIGIVLGLVVYNIVLKSKRAA